MRALLEYRIDRCIQHACQSAATAMSQEYLMDLSVWGIWCNMREVSQVSQNSHRQE